METTNEPDAIVEAFIDDAGNTGGDLGHPEQRNILLACLVVPYTRAPAFWAEVDSAWQIARTLTGGSRDVELKGEQLFGGHGPFANVSLADRCRILDAVVDSVIKQKAYVFWEGLPKHLWAETTGDLSPRPADADFWKSVLQAFLGETYRVLDSLYGPNDFRVTADENSWVAAGKVLSLRGRWPRLLNEGVIFRRSDEVRGLQVADSLVHSLYRTNKSSCPAPDKPAVTLSNTDKLASSYTQRLATGGVLVSLMHAASKLCGRKDFPEGA